MKLARLLTVLVFLVLGGCATQPGEIGAMAKCVNGKITVIVAADGPGVMALHISKDICGIDI